MHSQYKPNIQYRIKNAQPGHSQASFAGAVSKRKKKKRSFLLKAAFFISLALFASSIFLFSNELLQYLSSAAELTQIRQFTIDSTSLPYSQAESISKRQLPDFSALCSINSEAVGWIYIDGANVDHPIVQASDNEYYLSHTFLKNENASGCLFIDFRNSPGFSDQNTVVYGHRMSNGTMFSRLLDFRSQEKYMQCPFVSVYTAGGKAYHYQIFACLALEEDYDYRSPSYGESFASLISELRESSDISSSAKVDESDRIITLSTCSPDSVLKGGRYAVFAVLLNKGGNDIDLSKIQP
ncbi:MAG: class B sortase [Eubacteriaceae bacterium]|nr:class B sortase [Eubacteriaceae bacterium]